MKIGLVLLLNRIRSTPPSHYSVCFWRETKVAVAAAAFVSARKREATAALSKSIGLLAGRPREGSTDLCISRVIQSYRRPPSSLHVVLSACTLTHYVRISTGCRTNELTNERPSNKRRSVGRSVGRSAGREGRQQSSSSWCRSHSRMPGATAAAAAAKERTEQSKAMQCSAVQCRRTNGRTHTLWMEGDNNAEGPRASQELSHSISCTIPAFYFLKILSGSTSSASKYMRDLRYNM